MTTYFVIAGIIVCIYLSSFFSASEMAYSACNKMRLESRKEDGVKRAGLALFIAEHFDDALSAILIGNNLVNVACSSLGSVAVILIAGTDAYAWVATVIITVAVIIFGETIPKITAKKGANRIAERNAIPVRILMVLLKPLVMLVVALVRLISMPFKGEQTDMDAEEKVDELSTIIETAEDEKVLDEDQSELVQNAIDFSDVSASEAMTARVDVTAIDVGDSLEEIVEIIESAHHTRIPVYEDSIDHVIGILHMNHFLKAMTEDKDLDIRTLLMPPLYVYRTMKLPEVLTEFRRSRQHLAIVVDEYGGTLGVISMEDVLEQVVGEIWDETDTVEDEVVRRSENVYEVTGDMPIGDFLELAGIREEDFDAESGTVGGWTVESFGHFPKVGDSFRYGDLTISVMVMSDHRVERVLVRKEPVAEE